MGPRDMQFGYSRSIFLLLPSLAGTWTWTWNLAPDLGFGWKYKIRNVVAHPVSRIKKSQMKRERGWKWEICRPVVAPSSHPGSRREIAHRKDEYVVYDRLHHIQIYVHAMVKMRCVDRDRREKRGLYPDRSRADAGGSGGSIRNRLKLPKSQNQKSKI